MTDMFEKTEIERELKKTKERKKEILHSLGNLLGPLAGTHIRWLMAISAGFLIWLITALDQFCIDGLLFWKPLYIVMLLLQMFSTIVFFGVNGILFQWALKFNFVKALKDCSEEAEKDFIGEMEKRMPNSTIVTAAEIAFLVSFILFAVYVISFIIQHR